MKKIRNIICTALVLFCVISCKKNEGITVWSFNEEVNELINDYYLNDNPDFKFKYSFMPAEQFTSRLDTVLTSGRGGPDVFALEASFVQKYIESGLLLDLTDIYEKNKSKLLAYPVEIGTYNGRVYGMSLQVCPGAMFYRRSLARKYIGTDNPAVVQVYFANFNVFKNTAALLKSRSNDTCVVLSSCYDLYNVFLGARKNPWIVNGGLVIDPAIDAYLEMCKTIYENNYDARAAQRSESWFAGMNDSLFDENGNKLEVFAYFLSWDANNVLKANAGSTAGDWAVIPGPAPYFLGGTWLGAWKNTKNAGAAKQLIEYLTTNDDFLNRYALDSGDMVSNLNVVNRIKDSFTDPFLGDQNYYAAFAEITAAIDGRLVQITDQIIESIFAEEAAAYVNGEKTKVQALDDFKRQIQIRLGIN